MSLAAGSFFPNTKRGDSVWLFALEAGEGPSGPTAPTAGGDSELTH
jgi:hypothetical protein